MRQTCVCQSVSKPASQSGNQSVSQSESQTPSQSFSQLASQSVSQPAGQSAKQPVSQSVSQPVSQSVRRSSSVVLLGALPPPMIAPWALDRLSARCNTMFTWSLQGALCGAASLPPRARRLAAPVTVFPRCGGPERAAFCRPCCWRFSCWEALSSEHRA